MPPAALARRWAAAGRMDPLSADVVATLDGTLGPWLVWAVRSLDPSAELDDAVQVLALAQLEAQACGEGPSAALNRARRVLWRVCRRRGETRAARVPLAPAHDALLVDAGDALGTCAAWADLVAAVGPADARLVWLVAVDGWSLAELGRRTTLGRQALWHQVRRALARASPAFRSA